jgi:hypothetical protein
MRGSNNSNGYGLMVFGGKHRVATHIAWFLAHGVWPGKKFVLHKCDNPPCCNPDHLFLGTAADNAKDCIDKGRKPRGEKCKYSKRSQSQIVEIRALCATSMSLEEIGSKFGMSASAVSQIKERRIWDDGTKPPRKPYAPHKNAMRIEFGGKTYGISQLSKLTGVRGDLLKSRYLAGLREQELLQRKPYKKRSLPLI